MATGGYRAPPATSTTTDFLEEWKAKREKMRARLYREVPGSMLTAPMGGPGGPESAVKPPVVVVNNELNNNNRSSNLATMPDRTGGANCISVNTTSSLAKSSSSPSLRKPEEEQHVPLGAPSTAVCHVPRGRDAPEPALKKASEKVLSAALEPQEDALEGNGAVEEASKDTSTKAKEMAKRSGPSARKRKGQSEKRKMREKRRSTGVVNIPSLEVVLQSQLLIGVVLVCWNKMNLCTIEADVEQCPPKICINCKVETEMLDRPVYQESAYPEGFW
ncbi:PRKC apoptosis WT1 regulator protein-like [Lissotriton helveticus]